MNQKTPTVAELAERLDKVEAENAALRAMTGKAVAPSAQVEVVFTGLAVRTVDGEGGRPVQEVVGKPGDSIPLRSDIAAGWIRRGKCVPADSPQAKAFLDDKKALGEAIEEAEATLGIAAARERKRQAKERDIADAAAAKKQQAAGG